MQGIEELVEQYDRIAMVGDDINDAPAFATATVSIAMGAARRDMALETAAIALMDDDVTKLPYLYDLSRQATRSSNITSGPALISRRCWRSVCLSAS